MMPPSFPVIRTLAEDLRMGWSGMPGPLTVQANRRVGDPHLYVTIHELNRHEGHTSARLGLIVQGQNGRPKERLFDCQMTGLLSTVEALRQLDKTVMTAMSSKFYMDATWQLDATDTRGDTRPSSGR